MGDIKLSKKLVMAYAYFDNIQDAAGVYGVRSCDVLEAINEDKNDLGFDDPSYTDHLKFVKRSVREKMLKRFKDYKRNKKPRIGDTIQEGSKTLQVVEVLDGNHVVVSPIHHGKLMRRIRRCLELTPRTVAL